MLLGRFHEAFEPYEESDTDDWRRLRKSQQSQKTRSNFPHSFKHHETLCAVDTNVIDLRTWKLLHD